MLNVEQKRATVFIVEEFEGALKVRASDGL